ncbi:MAG TPA: AgmX/PglI C-terminal domain-containing protein [Kofleriaceae bacterium]|nr:AgmX/PglI C-terminal domain-containing protein [Kofleriaceae bacterium]
MRLFALAGLFALIALRGAVTPAHAESFVDPRIPMPPDATPGAPDADDADDANALPSLAIGDLGDRLTAVEAVDVALRVTDDRLLADVRLRVATSGLGRRMEVVPLALPHGAKVHAMVVNVGDGRSRARMTSAADGRDTYQFLVATRLRDPGLLELRDRDARVDHLQLHLYPVTRKAAAVVELAIELPRTAAFVVDLGPGPGPGPGPNPAAIHVAIAGAQVAAAPREPHQPLRFPIPGALGAARAGWLDAPVTTDAFVDDQRSLFAGPAPSHEPPVPVVRLGSPMCACGPAMLDKRSLRRYIKLHFAALTECFVHEAQYGKPDLAGKAILHFTIGRDGKVQSSAIEGEMTDPAVTGCLQREVAGWEFLGANEPVEVFYPLDFKGLK